MSTVTKISSPCAGSLRPITSDYLSRVLELLLNYLVSLSMPHDAASVEDLLAALQDEHQVKREVTEQVMRWYGDINAGLWSVHVEAVLKQVGLGILSHYKVSQKTRFAWCRRMSLIPQQHEAIALAEFLQKWCSAVGDTFESWVALPLLLVDGFFVSNRHQEADQF